MSHNTFCLSKTQRPTIAKNAGAGLQGRPDPRQAILQRGPARQNKKAPRSTFEMHPGSFGGLGKG
ncbi:MAG: hypothetical protein EBS01_08060 [Verrucomicrobia bacterium]|nr:hypothetical protein [Verrucomicrobiota bacterium]